MVEGMTAGKTDYGGTGELTLPQWVTQWFLACCVTSGQLLNLSDLSLLAIK